MSDIDDLLAQPKFHKFVTHTVEGEAWLAVLETHPMVEAAYPIGSARYRPEAKDVDLVVLLEEDTDPDDFRQIMLDMGFEDCGEHYDGADHWFAIRRGIVNLIVTSCDDFFHDSITASDVCVALNLTDKLQRQIVHKIIVDKAPDPWNPLDLTGV